MDLDPGFAGMTLEQLYNFDRRLDVEHERVLDLRARKGLRYPARGYFGRLYQAAGRVHKEIADREAKQAALNERVERVARRLAPWRCSNCGAHAQTGDSCSYCREAGPFLTGRSVVNQATVAA